jgi:hypothetical protein
MKHFRIFWAHIEGLGWRWVLADEIGPLYYRTTVQEAIRMLPQECR